MKSVLGAWNRYWFRPTRLLDLALFRIAVVGCQLLLFFPALRPQLALLKLPAALFVPLPMLKFMLAPLGHWGMRPSATLITVVWTIGLIAGLLALLGVLARPALAAFAWANSVLLSHLYSYGQVHHPEAVMVVALWMLVLAPSGASMSILRVRKRVREAVATMRFVPHRVETSFAPNTSEFALWPLRLVQWFMCLIYLSAGINKVRFGGAAWLAAPTLRFVLIGDATTRHAVIGLFAASHPAILPVLAAVSLGFELTFVLVMFFPSLTWLYIPLGVLIHTGIFALQDIRFFQFFVAYVAFAETMRRTWPTVRRFLSRVFKRPLTSPPREEWTLIYDGFCPLCTRTMVLIDAVDVTEQLSYIDFERDWALVALRAPSLEVDAARQAIHVVAPDGTVYRGYYGFKRLARQLPVLWPASLLLAIPGMDLLGVRVYDEVARRRGRTVCTPETCAVPLRPDS